MNCEYCEMAKGKSKNVEIIYADEEVAVAVKEAVLTPGQITVFPKDHFTIMEMVPDNILRKCAQLANKVGIAVFESLGCQGTNILIQNGTGANQKVPHFAMEIIPRREGDGLKLEWKPQQLMEDEMETTFLMLKDKGEQLLNLGKSEEKVVIVAPEESKKVKEEEGKENYLLKSLRRLP